jgi:hypothetical protein
MFSGVLLVAYIIHRGLGIIELKERNSGFQVSVFAHYWPQCPCCISGVSQLQGVTGVLWSIEALHCLTSLGLKGCRRKPLKLAFNHLRRTVCLGQGVAAANQERHHYKPYHSALLRPLRRHSGDSTPLLSSSSCCTTPGYQKPALVNAPAPAYWVFTAFAAALQPNGLPLRHLPFSTTAFLKLPHHI